VWVNGHYAGHRPYMSPWSRPQTLEMDVSEFIRPGRNQITLRVLCNSVRVLCNSDCFGANGIYERMFLYARTQQEEAGD